MRISHDLTVIDCAEEAYGYFYPAPKLVYKGSKSKYGYFDTTCTLDIETTNTPDDGFLYTIQFNIGGQNYLFRYVEDFIKFIEFLLVKWDISLQRRLVFYIHNLGYEHYYLTQILSDFWAIDKLLLTKPHKPLYIRFINGIEFRDSLKLFQKSLTRATKGLPHEKLTGDLDYRLYRTPDTALTQEEFDYCVNDVQGLYEAIERLKQDHGFNATTIPLTNTAMVVGEINKYIRKDWKVLRCFKELSLSKQQTILAYKCMAGGDTHGCRWRAGNIYDNCNSYDEKSAHPSQQLLKRFPSGIPIDMYDLKESDLNGLIQINHGWIAELFIVNVKIKSECPDPTISISKCEEIENLGGVDNGRLLSADGIRVYMDSNDWIRFKDAYTYDEVVSPYTVAFALKYLPESFRLAILEKFKIKESNRGGGAEYDFAKICVNTIFGACAQKSIRDEYTLSLIDGIEVDTQHWEDLLEDKDDEWVYGKQRMKLPFLWGLWTSSLSRLSIWEILKTVGWEKVIYWDTDSCKYEGPKLDSIKQYNKAIIQLCEERGATVVNDQGKPIYIGVAEDEYPDVEYGYKEFKFLHAKCYAARQWNPKTEKYELHTTIAGVGKQEGIEAMQNDLNNLCEGLYIPDAGGNKLYYNSRGLFKRTDFNRPTWCGSYIYMEPRDYEIKESKEKIDELDIEIIID